MKTIDKYFSKSIWSAIALTVISVTWFIAWKKETKPEEITNTKDQISIMKSDKPFTRQVEYKTWEYVDPVSKFSFQYPNNYSLDKTTVSGWNLHKDIEPGIELDFGEGTEIYGDLGENNNDPEQHMRVFQRNITTKYGYTAIQYLNINDLNHPQGLGTVYTIITDSKRSVLVYTFIGTILHDIYEQKYPESITDEDCKDILDNRIKAYDQVISSFKFL